MFMNRTSLKNLKTTWRPSLKTMVEESFNSFKFFCRKLIDYNLKKAWTIHCNFIHTQEGLSQWLCVNLHCIWEEKCWKNCKHLKKAQASFGLICLHTFMWAQVKKTQIGDQTSFCIKISAKTSLTPNYFLS
jgi:hypothetical protein